MFTHVAVVCKTGSLRASERCDASRVRCVCAFFVHKDMFCCECMCVLLGHHEFIATKCYDNSPHLCDNSRVPICIQYVYSYWPWHPIDDLHSLFIIGLCAAFHMSAHIRTNISLSLSGFGHQLYIGHRHRWAPRSEYGALAIFVIISNMYRSPHIHCVRARARVNLCCRSCAYYVYKYMETGSEDALMCARVFRSYRMYTPKLAAECGQQHIVHKNAHPLHCVLSLSLSLPLSVVVLCI